VDEMSGGSSQSNENRNESKETESAKLDGFRMKSSETAQDNERSEETKATQAAKLLEEQKREAAREASEEGK
jgi:hypothetical protein